MGSRGRPGAIWPAPVVYAGFAPVARPTPCLDVGGRFRTDVCPTFHFLGSHFRRWKMFEGINYNS
eukprot:9179315-Alexandrium_andersonii.AAC.1